MRKSPNRRQAAIPEPKKTEIAGFMSKLTPAELDEDLALLRASVVSAGILALGYFRRDIKKWAKQNSSPVSEADIVVDEFLGEALTNARPDYGWLSEETADDQSRLDYARIFVVDPIDGTRGFLHGDEGWTICASVVENGEAKAGVVYAPARDELFEARLGGGALLNGLPIELPEISDQPPLVPGPAAVHTKLKEAGFRFEKARHYPSLAFRLLQVATGNLDVAIARRGSQDWDIAASNIILRECGIDLLDVCVGAPIFNREEVRHGALAAMLNPQFKKPIHDALIEVYGCSDETA